MQSIPLAEAVLLGGCLDRLEADWSSTQGVLPMGQLPAYLPGTKVSSRGGFVQALIDVDLEIRRTRDLNPSPAEYLQVFPDLLVEIQRSFQTCAKPPPHIGRYKVEDRLGTGGFGSVYRASDQELDRHVAIKLPLAGRLFGRATSNSSGRRPVWQPP